MKHCPLLGPPIVLLYYTMPLLQILAELCRSFQTSQLSYFLQYKNNTMGVY